LLCFLPKQGAIKPELANLREPLLYQYQEQEIDKKNGLLWATLEMLHLGKVRITHTE